MLVVFVAETVPSQNKGEAALMHGIVRSISEYAGQEVQFYLCSERKELDQKEYGDKVRVLDNKGLIPTGSGSVKKLMYFFISAVKHAAFLVAYYLLGSWSLKLFRDELWRAYYTADVIILGHDNAFSKFHIPLIFYAKLLRKKVAVYGATIMPVVLNTGFIRRLAKMALNRVDLITTRESLTYRHLKEIGVENVPLFCTADKAFILEPGSVERTKELTQRLDLDNLPKPVIGVMVVKGSTVYKAAFKGRDYTPEEKYEKHAQEIAKALDATHKLLGGTYVFVPHCIGPGADLDDRLCAKAVTDKMSSGDNAKIINDDLRVTELKGILGTFDMVVSERTHGGINAASMNVPTLWISHPNDHRTYGIVTNTLQLPECLYNIETLDSESLSEKIVKTYEMRARIAEKLEVNIPKAQEATMKNGVHFKEYVLDKK